MGLPEHPLVIPPMPPRADRDYITNTLLPMVERKVIQDFNHYGDTYQELGLKGQYADIHRKVGPLKRALWDDVHLVRETPREICFDLIGHLLLTIMLIDAKERSGG